MKYMILYVCHLPKIKFETLFVTFYNKQICLNSSHKWQTRELCSGICIYIKCIFVYTLELS